MLNNDIGSRIHKPLSHGSVVTHLGVSCGKSRVALPVLTVAQCQVLVVWQCA
jgi:hypothetical protein